jgi:hypothetical protein
MQMGHGKARARNIEGLNASQKPLVLSQVWGRANEKDGAWTSPILAPANGRHSIRTQEDFGVSQSLS